MWIVKISLVAVFVLLWSCDGGAAVNCDGEPLSTEGKLMKKLFCYNYDKTERPVKNHTSSLNVSMNMHVQNYDVYESRLTLNLYVWMSMLWMDEFLNWDRTEYDMEKLIVDSSELWRPTIVPLNNMDNGDAANACSSYKCEVKASGEVRCIPPCDYKAYCTSNTVDWPFDILDCWLYLGMWVDGVDKIMFQESSNVATNDIQVSNADWKLLKADIQRVHLEENSSYPKIKYTFVLERHIAIYGVVLTPGFVLLAINLAVLWMNNGNNERLYILCATCMAHFTYLEYLYWRVPYHGEQVPKMLIFFRDSLIINVLILACTVILRHIRESAEHSERFIDKLATRVASTNLGRVLLQADEEGNTKAHPRTETVDGAGNENNTGASNADGDTVNLVVDGPDTDAQPGRARTVDATNPILVATFMDRIMFLCCLLCYGFMIGNLLPTGKV
uniref:Neurotransmitter-gated ion-channel ligand-binding domain-containing protein n=1 Tax=Anopheles atroparvus TaxID=41427 RepID=A0A182ITP5_ANOAO